MSVLDYQYIAKLVTRAMTGDSDAFAELYAATYQRLYHFAYHYLKDEYLAQDALQETYILVLKNIHSLKNPELFISWLNQICFRICFNMQKKNTKHKTELSDYEASAASQEADPYDNPENQAIRIDEKEYLIRQVLNLPFTESQVIFLKYYQNMKLEDIAKMLDISRSSVKRYLVSGRRRLKQLIEH